MKKKLVLLYILFLALPGAICAQKYSAEKIDIPRSGLGNLYRIDEGIYRSEQPSKRGFAALEGIGVTEVLNLRKCSGDGRRAKERGLELHHMRSKARELDEAQMIEALKIINDRKGAILIHCRYGSDRTGAVIAMYRIIFQNVPKEEAIREMQRGGFGFHGILFGNIPEMIRAADTEHIKNQIGVGDNQKP